MAEGETKRGTKIWRRLSVAICLFVALWLIAWAAAKLLIVSEPLERAEAVVVLSGSKTLMERVTLAAQLLKEGRAKKVILTNDNLRGGWISAEQRNPFFYEGAIKELRRLGVPDEAIVVIPTPVTGTQDEALVVREYLQPPVGTLIVVTSAYHSRRALRSFKKVFAGTRTAVGIAPVKPGIQTPPASTWWLHRRGWEMVPVEYAKLAYYVVRY